MFVQQPESTRVLEMPSLTTLTPYYKEEVVSLEKYQRREGVPVSTWNIVLRREIVNASLSVENRGKRKRRNFLTSQEG